MKLSSVHDFTAGTCNFAEAEALKEVSLGPLGSGLS